MALNELQQKQIKELIEFFETHTPANGITFAGMTYWDPQENIKEWLRIFKSTDESDWYKIRCANRAQEMKNAMVTGTCQTRQPEAPKPEPKPILNTELANQPEPQKQVKESKLPALEPPKPKPQLALW